MKARDFITEKLERKIQADRGLLSDTGLNGKNISIELSGPSGGTWNFSFDGTGQLDLKSGSPSLAADCAIQMKDETFMGIVEGTVNVPVAFLFRKIKVKGDQGLAAKLGLALQKNVLKA